MPVAADEPFRAATLHQARGPRTPLFDDSAARMSDLLDLPLLGSASGQHCPVGVVDLTNAIDLTRVRSSTRMIRAGGLRRGSRVS